VRTDCRALHKDALTPLEFDREIGAVAIAELARRALLKTGHNRPTLKIGVKDFAGTQGDANTTTLAKVEVDRYAGH
jgi:hypothetical protein